MSVRDRVCSVCKQHKAWNKRCFSAAALAFLLFFLRPYLSICMFSISIDTRGVDKSPQWGPGTRGDLG